LHGRWSERRTRLLAVTTVAVAAVGLAACSSSSSGGGSAAPSGSSGGSTPSSAGSTSAPAVSSGGKSQTITVAVTANPLMTTIEQLTPGGFEATHPGIKVKFVTYDENTERADVEKDVAAHGGQYDVVMIGPNDIASWAKNGWISDLTSDAAGDPTYDVGDIIKPIGDALSSDGKL
jgi:sorbitol/mannitol transport system substrate-binding protein